MSTQLAKSIATDRQALGLSQHDLAEKVGVTQQSVSKWEEGLARPRGKRLNALIAALGKKSHTAAAVSRILISTYSETVQNQEETPLARQHVTQEQALAALAAAAQEIAQAARALADSVAHLTQQPRVEPPQH